MNKKKKRQVSGILDTPSPKEALREVKNNFTLSYKEELFIPIKETFKDFQALFTGEFPGYRGCDTPYHDIYHSSEALLALSRIIDGYNIKNDPLPVKMVTLALISALMHDVGLIPRDSESPESGAVYMADHVKRSIDFTKRYLKEKNYTERETGAAAAFIKVTDLDISINNIKFNSSEEVILACMVGTADLIGQMASRTYLEKLQLLYREFRDAGIPEYESEFDLLKKTASFYRNIVLPRLENDFKDVKKYADIHLIKRKKVSSQTYRQAIKGHLKYLNEIVASSPGNYKKKLRRRGRK